MNELSFGDEEVCKVGECILCVFAVLGVFALKPSCSGLLSRKDAKDRKDAKNTKSS
jgi:hypothetical protein